jgi:hypothetical protein
MSGAANGYARPPASEKPMDTRLYETGAGLPPAGQAAPHGGLARSEFFGRLRPPMQNGTGKVPGAKSRGGAS